MPRRPRLCADALVPAAVFGCCSVLAAAGCSATGAPSVSRLSAGRTALANPRDPSPTSRAGVHHPSPAIWSAAPSTIPVASATVSAVAPVTRTPLDAARQTPGQLFAAELAGLRPGTTLRLAPGSYPIGALAITLPAGTAAQPITVTAADPTRPPQLLGALQLRSADHWTFSNLHLTGTVPRTPTLWMLGGTGWTLDHDEVDGAHATGSLANLAVSSLALPVESDPTNWTIENSCVHGAGSPPVETSYTAIHYQNVYINAWGSLHGTFAHNVLFGAPDGENLKVGDGPMDQRNASDVKVLYNTSYDSSTGFIVGGHGSTGITVAHNLIVWIHTKWRPLIGIEVNRVDVPNGTRIVANYGYRLDSLVRGAGPVTVAAFLDRGNSLVRLPGTGNPGFTSTTCGGFRTTNPVVAGYGVWAGR